MDCGNTVNGKAVMNIDVSHMYSVVFIDDGNLGIFVFCLNSFIQFFYDRNELGHNLFKILKRPFFECFRKDCMVCVSTSF